ncbi:MAG: hypothetical protein K2K75_01700 [Muribaculaceae bacterium]|nr:hypothetical protein [Muribaculaceae bacterium]
MLIPAEVPLDAVDVYVWCQCHSVAIKQRQEVVALGGGGDGGTRAFEGGEVGEGLIY